MRITPDNESTPSAMPLELVLSNGDNVWVPSLSSGRKAARVVSYDVNTVCVGMEHETACGELAWSLHWVRRSSVQRWNSLDDLTPEQIKAFGDELSEAGRRAIDGRLGPNFIKRLLETHPPT
jgi:hypothetical protein